MGLCRVRVTSLPDRTNSTLFKQQMWALAEAWYTVTVIKSPPASAGDTRDPGSIPGPGRPLEEEMAPTPGFLPGESHGQRSLAGYGPQSCKELDTTEATEHARIHDSVQFSRSVVSDSLGPREPQHTRPPCPSPAPGVYPNSRPLSRRCHPTISSSVVPFSSRPQSFPTSGLDVDIMDEETGNLKKIRGL